VKNKASDTQSYVFIGSGEKFHALRDIKTSLINGNPKDLINGFDNEVRNAGDIIYGDSLSVKVESGVLHENTSLTLMPMNKEIKVKNIEKSNDQKPFAVAGQLCEINFTFNRKDLDPDYIKSGAVLCDPMYPVH